VLLVATAASVAQVLLVQFPLLAVLVVSVARVQVLVAAVVVSVVMVLAVAVAVVVLVTTMALVHHQQELAESVVLVALVVLQALLEVLVLLDGLVELQLPKEQVERKLILHFYNMVFQAAVAAVVLV
jgi:hypothetical protein